MKLQTKRFGEIEIKPESIITFPKGLLGFPEFKKFVLLDPNEKSPLKWLQSIENKNLAFVVTDPLIFKSDYEVAIFKSDLEEIELDDPEKASLWVVVTVPHNPSKMTANLKGPILINSENNIAKQLVLDNPDYSLKYRLISDEEVKRAV